MQEPRVSAEELERALAADVHRLAEEIAEAMNAAQDGRVIADTEEPVRDAHATFRQQAYQKALSLLQKKQGAFFRSPSGLQNSSGDPEVPLAPRLVAAFAVDRH